MRLAVIGGGAAGIFGAIAAAESNPAIEATVLEATDQPLDKVHISGGGRCNVTHHCFDPTELVKSYPRGHKELLGAFHRFQPQDTIAWFEQRGVATKVEPDGRMFPTTDNSQTIIDCLLDAARKSGVKLRLNARVKSIVRKNSAFIVTTHPDHQERFDYVLIATGSSRQGYRMAESLGHTIIPTVPSLFTFKVKDARLESLAGVSFPDVHLTLSVESKQLVQRGPMLITHWGLSGPAVLKLSAWAARELHAARYRAELTVNFAPDLAPEEVQSRLRSTRETDGRKQVASVSPIPLPRRYWQRLCKVSGLDQTATWNSLPKQHSHTLAGELERAVFAVKGKGIFKEEFVTCGGVSLKEVDFKTMQSRVCPGLYLAGEVLDIDGITGGFNFQSAWTTGWLAGRAIINGR